MDHRLGSVEQPIWQITKADESGWSLCSQGNVCRCWSETSSLNCWNRRLKAVPFAQYVPLNIATIDLSSNSLLTFHKDTFRGLNMITSLDMSLNRINYIPKNLLWDMENLVKL